MSQLALHIVSKLHLEVTILTLWASPLCTRWSQAYKDKHTWILWVVHLHGKEHTNTTYILHCTLLPTSLVKLCGIAWPANTSFGFFERWKAYSHPPLNGALPRRVLIGLQIKSGKFHTIFQILWACYIIHALEKSWENLVHSVFANKNPMQEED